MCEDFLQNRSGTSVHRTKSYQLSGFKAVFNLLKTSFFKN